MALDLDTLLSEAEALIQDADSLDKIEAARVELLGKKGRLTSALKAVGQLPKEEKPAAGQAVNKVKQTVQGLLTDRLALLDNEALAEKLASDAIDITLPGRAQAAGGLHPITLTIERISALFAQLGFDVALGPEIEDDYHNFEALNFPAHHPARAMHDTFYFDANRLLRTHTSSVQIRYMKSNPPPMRILVPGRVYRCDSDQTHSPMFHQVEGLLVDTDVGLTDLFGHLEGFLKLFFDQDDCDIRFRPSYFPFTEPSAEMDISCFICEGTGCSICKKTGWVEILGCGMVDPAVLQNCNIDPEIYSGYAWGMGIDRTAMLKYKIDDIRLFFENDVRFIRQFASA